MHSIIIAIFLINSLYYSIGYPVSNVTQNLILQHLSNDCKNSFLADILKQNNLRCNINETRLSQYDLECFMFYDINSQLCATFNHSEFNLLENYNTKINETLNVASLCEHAKTWKLTTVKEHPRFNILEKVFNDSVNCQKLCGVGDLLSDDANYFCLYFKWGTDIIQKQHSTLQETNVLAPNSSSNHIENSDSSSSTTNTASVSSIKEHVKPVENKSKLHESVKQENDDVISLFSSFPNIQIFRPVLTNNQTANAVIGQSLEINNSQKNTEQSIAPGVSSSVRAEMEKPPTKKDPPKKDELEKNEHALDTNQESKDILLKPEFSNQNEDDENDDDFVQSDELQEVIKNHDNDVIEPDPNVVIKDQNKVRLGIESITSNNGNHPLKVPELFPNTLQDSFTDDDDHFFPIFLTAIILVVLLYILYHNKSKFTKVILGLILEGRQSGRRRNSRGHAYRRLDTLEQAMSTNTAAPPSKIIY